MGITYPFIPKSNEKLEPGQFWPIRLSTGRYACGIVLEIPRGEQRHSTKMFYAGLLDWAGDSKPTVLSLQACPLHLLNQGHAHLKTILHSDAAIEGKIDLISNHLETEPRVDSHEYSEFSKVLKGYQVIRKATRQDHEKLRAWSTWGYAFINCLAERFLSK